MPLQRRSFATPAAPMLPPPRARVEDVNSICGSLTARQHDVLALMMQGKSNKAICRVLNLAEQTVKNYVSVILKALKASNRTEAVVKVSKAGIALRALAPIIVRLPDISTRKGQTEQMPSGPHPK
jgi:DNA-binding NarL/FixJ family response regulator